MFRFISIIIVHSYYKSLKKTKLPDDGTGELKQVAHCLLPGGKGSRCLRMTTLPPSCVVMKSGNLNFLEPSRPLQACNGTASPFLKAHNKLNTYIYQHVPPTCFGVCYTIFRETTSLFAQNIYTFCNVVICVCCCTILLQ
jgi:hypothetical protein